MVGSEVDGADLQDARAAVGDQRAHDNAAVSIDHRCPVCRSAFADRPIERWSTFDLLSCPRCDLQLWSPPLPGDASWYDTSDHYLAMPIVDWLGWYHRRGLAKVPASARSLLDIGCADGRFVHAAVARGVDAHGIDHSERLVALGNERYGGDRLSTRSLQQIRATGQTFDIVTLFEVTEHVPDPLDLLRAAWTVLTPGGTIIVSTPNRLGSPRPPAELDRPPHHLTRWSPDALRYALGEARFEVRSIDLSPGRVGLQAELLGRFRLGLIVRTLRRRADRTAASGVTTSVRDVRNLIRLKDAIASVAATLLAPLIGHRFRGGSMVAVATSRADA